MWTTFLLIFLSIVLGAGAWLLFLWAVRSGQFEDVEGPKHRILDDDPEPAPGEEVPTSRRAPKRRSRRSPPRRRS